MMTNEQRILAEREGVFIPPRAGFPSNANFVRPDYYSQRNAQIEQGLATREMPVMDEKAIQDQYTRALAERMANETMNRQQQAQQGRQLVNPLPSKLNTADRQGYIDQHPLSENRVVTNQSAANDAVLADMARENSGGYSPGAQPAATGGPSETQEPAFVGQLRSSAQELSGMTTKQEYDDLIQRLSTGETPETVAGLKAAGQQYLTQINPRLGTQVADQKLVEAKNEDALAGWYRATVEPAKGLSNQELSQKVMSTPELKSRFGLEVGEITGAGGMALPLNPEIRDVLSVKISADQERMPYGGSTVGDVINKAQRALLASSGMPREARGKIRAEAIMAVGDALDAVKTRLNETKALIDSGAIQTVAQLGVQGANVAPKTRDMAFQEVKARVGDDNLLQSYAPVIQGINIDSTKLLPKTGILKPTAEGAEADLIKYYPGNGIPEMTGQVVIDLQATIDKKKPMSPEQMQAAVENSITKVLSNNSKRIDVFSAESGQRVIADLTDAVKTRLAEQWKQTSERVDTAMMTDKILPLVSSFVDDSAIVQKWTPDKAEFEYGSIANLLSDGSAASKQFIQQLDINGNQIIDRPEELAAAWMVKKYGAGIIPIARQLADGTFRFAGNRDQTQQLYDGFSALVDQFSGGMAAASVKTAVRVNAQYDKLVANFDQVRRMPAIPQQQESQAWSHYRATGLVPDTEWLSAANPEANVVKVGDQQYLARNPVMAQVLRDAFGSTLDSDTKNVLLNVINPKNGYLGGGLPADQFRIITGAIGDHDDALVDMSNDRDKIFFQTMNADINKETQKSAPPDKSMLTGKPGQVMVYTRGGATADHISLAPIKTVIANDPQLSLLWRTGIDSRNPRWAKMAYQLAREKVRNEISADMGNGINKQLNTYLAGLRDVLGIDQNLNPDTDRQRLMQALVAQYRPAITEVGSAADSVAARDIVDKIGILSRDVKAKRDAYHALGLMEPGENGAAIDNNLKWMDKIATEPVPARPLVTGTQQNVVTTAVAGGQ
jgi:hypothetical protein